MKKIIFSILTAVFITLAISSSAFAADLTDGRCLGPGDSCASGKSHSDYNCIPTDVRCGVKPAGTDANVKNPDQTDTRVTNAKLNKFDPLLTEGSPNAAQLSTPRGIISRVLEFAFPLAGIGMFVMIVIGGFQILTGAGEQKSMESGRQKVTTAIVGFVLLFSSYWIAQILEQLFGIKIL